MAIGGRHRGMPRRLPAAVRRIGSPRPGSPDSQHKRGMLRIVRLQGQLKVLERHLRWPIDPQRLRAQTQALDGAIVRLCHYPEQTRAMRLQGIGNRQIGCE